jgi:ABC-type nickel/cobalt efflux system permease component RcnA
VNNYLAPRAALENVCSFVPCSCYALLFFSHHTVQWTNLEHTLRLTTAALGWIYMMYFLLGMKRTGHFVVMIAKMLVRDLVPFSLFTSVFIGVLFPRTHAHTRTHARARAHTHAHTHAHAHARTHTHTHTHTHTGIAHLLATDADTPHSQLLHSSTSTPTHVNLTKQTNRKTNKYPSLGSNLPTTK